MSNSAEQVESLFLSFLGDNPKSDNQIRSLMTKRIAKDPGPAEPWIARAWAYWSLGEAEEAIADASAGIERCPESHLGWYIRGEANWLANNNGQAEQDLTEAICRASGIKLWLEAAYRSRGGIRCDAKRTKEAIADLNACLKLSPEDETAFAFRANAYCHLEQFRKAIADFERAIAIEPEDDYAIANLSWLLATCLNPKFRDGQRALELAEEANTLAPRQHWKEVAAAHAELGDFRKAIKSLEKAIKECEDKEELAKMNRLLKAYQQGVPLYTAWDE